MHPSFSLVLNRNRRLIQFFSICLLTVLLCGTLLAIPIGAQFSGVQSTIGSLSGFSNTAQPAGVAVDGSGNVYVVDTANNQVLKETLQSNGSYIQTVIITGLSGPRGVAVDSVGNVYVADTLNNQVLMETLSAGSYTPTVIANNTSVGLWEPYGVAVDTIGNVYIADTGSNRVLMGTLSAGVFSPTNYFTGLANPGGVAVDTIGNVYIADTNNNRVLMETLSAGVYTQSTLVIGLNAPYGVAVDTTGNVYITDTLNNRVLKETSGTYAPSMIFSGLSSPYGVAVGANGNVYIADTYTPRVLMESLSGGNFGTVNAGTKSSTISLVFTFKQALTLGPNVVLTQGAPSLDFADATTGTCLPGSYGIAATCTVDVTFTPKFAGFRYGAAQLVDNSNKVLATGYVFGSGSGPQVNFLPGVQSTIPTSGVLPPTPYGVAVDGGGNIYVADTANNQVLKQTLSAGSYTQSSISISGSFSNTPAPYGIAVDGAGNVYITDTANNQVLKETLSAGIYTQSVIATAGLATPHGIAVDGSGNVYVADSGNSRVVMVPWTGNAYSTQRTIPAAGLGSANAVAVDGSGNVYIADPANSQVLMVPWTNGAYGIPSVIGTTLSAPYWVAVDGNGNVYITDSSLNSTLKETLSAGTYAQSTIATNGLSALAGIAVDGSGNVYIGASQQLVKLDFADAPTLSFLTTNAGSVSTDSPKTVTVENVGNGSVSLNISSIATAANFTLQGSSTTCSSTNQTLNAAASCALGIEFSPVDGGTISGSVILTDNNLNGTGVTQTINLGGTALNVPVISWTPAAITFGTPLGAGQLNATATGTGGIPLTGGFVYSSAFGPVGPGTVLPAGVGQQLSVTFTPNDPTYATVNATASLTVNQATPIVTWATPAAINYGTALSATQLNATFTWTINGSTVPVTGTPTYNPLAGVVLPAGLQTLSVTFLPNDTTEYTTTATGSVQLQVNQAAPTSWPTIVSASQGSPSILGQPVTFSVAVAPNATGQVLFYDGGVVIGSSNVDSNGNAAFTTALLQVGSGHSITASYSGDANYLPSGLTTALPYTVSPRPVLMPLIGFSVNPVGVGAPTTATVTVTDLASTGPVGTTGAGTPGSFVTTANALPAATTGQTATLLQDGTVLLVGGTVSGSVVNTAVSYSYTNSSTDPTLDPRLGVFTAIASPTLNAARSSHTATLLPDGTVLVVGGTSGGTTALNSAEIINPNVNPVTVTPVGNTLIAARYGHTATLVNGKVLISGGQAGGAPVTSLEVYDPVAKTFTLVTGGLAANRIGHTATLLADGQTILVAGGDVNPTGNPLATATAELITYNSSTFTSANIATPVNLPLAISGHTATLLPDGTVALAGGLTVSPAAASGAVVLFQTPATPITAIAASNFVTLASALQAARSNHTATLLDDGLVLLTGGTGSLGTLASAEIYTPSYDPRGAVSSIVSASATPVSDTVSSATCTLAPTGNGSPTCTATITPAEVGPGGTHTASASYAGDSDHGAASTVNFFAVTKGTPVFTNLTSPSAIYGQTISFSGAILAGTQAPTGQNVTINVAGTGANAGITQNYTSAAIQSSGSFSLSTLPSGPLPVGLYNVTYSYAGDGINFNAAATTTSTITVNQAPLTVTANNISKTYGTTYTFTGAEFTTSGLVNSDTVTSATLSSPGAAATASVVAPGPTYTISISAAVGTGLSNYTISYNTGTMTLGQAALTITANNQSKTYGTLLVLGTTAFTTTPASLPNGDTIAGVTLTSAGVVVTAHVVPGSPYTITPSLAVPGGATQLGNYNISYANAPTGLTVNPAALTITANNQSKTYGQTLTLGTTLFTTTPTQGTLPNGDSIASVTLNSAGAAATAHVVGPPGLPYSITPSAAVAGGTTQLTDYTITYATTGTLTVNPAPLMITAGNQGKTYGQTLVLGTTLFTTTPAQGTLPNGDSIAGVTLSSLGAAGTAHVVGPPGSPYTITPSVAVAGGSTQLTDYTITYVVAPIGLTVNPLPVTLTPTTQSEVYGTALGLGTTGFTPNPAFPNGDSMTVTMTSTAGAAGTTTAQVQNGLPYPITITPGSAVAGNNTQLTDYSITYSFLTAGLTVTPRPITLTANDRTKVYGTAVTLGITAYTPSSTLSPPFVNGDNVTVTLTSGGAAGTAHVVGPNPSVPLSPYTITPSAAVSVSGTLSNYTITYANAPTGFTVTPAPLTLTASGQQKMYGQVIDLGTTKFTTTPVAGSLPNGDSISGVTLYSTQAAICTATAPASYTIAPSVAVGGASVANGSTLVTDYAITYVNGSLAVIQGTANATMTASFQPLVQPATGEAIVAISVAITPDNNSCVGGAPNGTVTFTDSVSGVKLATISPMALTPGQTNSTMSYNMPLSLLSTGATIPASGPHTITVTFTPTNTNFSGDMANGNPTAYQTVIQVQVAVKTYSAGQTDTVNVTGVTSVPTGTTLDCTVVSLTNMTVSNATCTASLSGTTTVAVTFSISNGSTTAAVRRPSSLLFATWLGIPSIIFLPFALSGVRRKSWRRKVLSCLGLVLVFAILLSVVSCGGNGFTNSAGLQPNTGAASATPPDQYAAIVTNHATNTPVAAVALQVTY